MRRLLALVAVLWLVVPVVAALPVSAAAVV